MVGILSSILRPQARLRVAARVSKPRTRMFKRAVNTRSRHLTLAAAFPARRRCSRALVRARRRLGPRIGMSQWGAYGYARHGASYREILDHYYRGTQIGSVPVSSRARLAAGEPLRPSRSGARPRPATASSTEDRCIQRDARGRQRRAAQRVADVASRPSAGVMRVVGRQARAPAGPGRQRRPRRPVPRSPRDPRGLRRRTQRDQRRRPGGLPAGVVPGESPPSGRRSAPGAGGRRALVRAGLERRRQGLRPVRRHPQPGVPRLPCRDALDERRRRCDRRRGGDLRRRVATTFFFSTSGGHTENVENVFTGSDPKPWLKGVEDPYDDASPYHRWGPYSLFAHGAGRSWAAGSRAVSESSRSSQRGVSPRVVRRA